MPHTQLPLGDIAQIFTGMPTKASEVVETGPWGNVITVRNLLDGGVDLENLSEISEVDRDVERYRVEAGDLLISSRSTSLRTSIVPEAAHRKLINATVIGLRPHTILPRLLSAWLSSTEGMAELEGVAQSGTSQMNITVSGLEKLMIPVPDLAVQRQMAELLETTDQAYKTAIEAADSRRQIAHEIVVNDMMKENA